MTMEPVTIAGVVLDETKLRAGQALRKQGRNYADVAEAFGLPRGEWPAVREALDAIPIDVTPAEGETSLDALLRQARTMDPEETDEFEATIRASRAELPIRPDEGLKLQQIYSTGAPITFEEMGASLDPPRMGLTVSRYIADQGWVRPQYKLPVTHDDAGMTNQQIAEQEAADRAAAVKLGHVTASGARQPIHTIRTSKDSPPDDIARMRGPDAEAEQQELAERNDAAARRAHLAVQP